MRIAYNYVHFMQFSSLVLTVFNYIICSSKHTIHSGFLFHSCYYSRLFASLCDNLHFVNFYVLSHTYENFEYFLLNGGR